jgi:hypothetical protein
LLHIADSNIRKNLAEIDVPHRMIILYKRC